MKQAIFVVLLSFVLASGCGTPAKDGARPERFLATDIDTTVSPASDFFRYANGAWLKANPIPPSERMWGVGNLVQEETYARLKGVCEEAASSASAPAGSPLQKIGDYYAAALDTANIEKKGIAPLEADLLMIDSVRDVPGALLVVAHLQKYGGDPGHPGPNRS